MTHLRLKRTLFWTLAWCGVVVRGWGADLEGPDPVQRPLSPVMLRGDWVPTNPRSLNFAQLPKIPSRHVVVSDVRAGSPAIEGQNLPMGGVNQHNYLIHHGGRFWVMWSDGPGREDRVGQRVKFATSDNGLRWTKPEFLTPVPPQSGPDSPFYGTREAAGFRWIARGFWLRDGELLALASLDEAAGFFGPSLALQAFRWNADQSTWDHVGVLARDAINNFPPQRLPTGEWMMSRRAHDYKTMGVHFLVGGVKALDDWVSFPVLGSSGELKAEEPLWWELPDRHLMALFRDNHRSGFLYRAFSIDNGRTWTEPVKTNFPDATSKIHGLRLSDGRYVLVSNANPKRRDPLTIAVSDDGLVFTKLATLMGGRHVDYPHILEHAGQLYVAFAGQKQTVEIVSFPISELDNIAN